MYHRPATASYDRCKAGRKIPISTKILLSVTRHTHRHRPTFESTAYMLEASGLPSPWQNPKTIEFCGKDRRHMAKSYENPWDQGS